MNEDETISPEAVISEVDKMLAKINDYKNVTNDFEYLSDMIRLRRLGDQLDSEAKKPVITHIWNRMIITSVSGSALPPADDQIESQVQNAKEAREILSQVRLKDVVAAVGYLWRARRLISVHKMLMEYLASSIRDDQFYFLDTCLKNWMPRERYEIYSQQIYDFKFASSNYRDLSKIARVFIKPPIPPEEPKE